MKHLKFYLFISTILMVACTVKLATKNLPQSSVVESTRVPAQSFDDTSSVGTFKNIPLSPEESLKKFILPPGYHLELVAAEPMITEPVAIAWDGNAKMYVAQMETYTQDADGTGTKDKKSRVMLLEDTDNDGKMDKSSVFIKDLILPRMLLCVDHKVLVNETDTYDIFSYEDTNNDGIADVKKPVYTLGRVSPGNLEHQRSGLVWNVDNYIYQTVDPIRFRYTQGILKPDSLYSGSNGQWGLTNDNYGRLFFSRAGGENAGSGFQINPKYGSLEFSDAYSEEKFSPVYSRISNPDVQGGKNRLRPDSTLNHFTSANGQSVFRGDRLPKDLIGDYIINEPVARIIRRAKIVNKEGKTVLENVYHRREFISSTDPFFRPVNTYSGPDGQIYIVDMSRGVIQESNWTRKGEFLRNKIDYYGLAKVNQRGRIWRLVHDDFKRGPQPHLLDTPAKDLLTFLNHPNGWWRDNAQKQIIVLHDKSVVPTLNQMVRGQNSEITALGRLHALWTLEGLNEITKDNIKTALKDEDPQIRKAGVWIGEKYIKRQDEEMIDLIAQLKVDPSFEVKTQVLLSLGSAKNEKAKQAAADVLSSNPKNQMLSSVRYSMNKNEDNKMYGVKLGGFTANDRKLILAGGEIYKSICSSCHGMDGKGLASNAAPAFTSARHINADKEIAIRILLHGLKGPIDGKIFPSEMVSMKENSDEWIASVLSYIRYEFVGTSIRSTAKRQSAVIQPEDVKIMRDKYSTIKTAWTIEDFDNIAPAIVKK